MGGLFTTPEDPDENLGEQNMHTMKPSPLRRRRIYIKCIASFFVVAMVIYWSQFAIATAHMDGASTNGNRDDTGETFVCGRQVSVDVAGNNSVTFDGGFSQEGQTYDKIVLVGDGKPFGQTNNRFVAGINALEYANRMGAHLAVTPRGWFVDTFAMLFGPSHPQNTTRDRRWEEFIRLSLGIIFIDPEIDIDESECYHGMKIIRVDAKELFYAWRWEWRQQHVSRRMLSFLRLLWSNPNRGADIFLNGQELDKNHTDMCIAVNDLISPGERYAVVHSRWLDGSCLYRASLYANWSGVDAEASCFMTPEYVKDILRSEKMLRNHIIVITDGQNPDIVDLLRKDDEIGPYMKTVPDAISWVGGDMMLGVLSDVFIGTGLSTFALNIEIARVALGFNESTNYLRMRKKVPTKEDPREWGKCRSEPKKFNNGSATVCY